LLDSLLQENVLKVVNPCLVNISLSTNQLCKMKTLCSCLSQNLAESDYFKFIWL